MVAGYFAMQLAQLRRGVQLIDLSDLLADQILDMTADDLLIIFEPRGATASLVGLLAEARARGSQCQPVHAVSGRNICQQRG